LRYCAGYNYTQGNTSNPTQSSSAPADTELGQTFASSSDAVIWATDVLGEFEINKWVFTSCNFYLHFLTRFISNVNLGFSVEFIFLKHIVNACSELFYRIGGANRIRPPLTPDANVKIGFNNTANLPIKNN
jgi:hypothetical protein